MAAVLSMPPSPYPSFRDSDSRHMRTGLRPTHCSHKTFPQGTPRTLPLGAHSWAAADQRQLYHLPLNTCDTPSWLACMGLLLGSPSIHHSTPWHVGMGMLLTFCSCITHTQGHL